MSRLRGFILAAAISSSVLVSGCASDNLSSILAQDRNACASINGLYLGANVKLQACRLNDPGSITVTTDGQINMDIRATEAVPIQPVAPVPNNPKLPPWKPPMNLQPGVPK